jgi:hypothetical protein
MAKTQSSEVRFDPRPLKVGTKWHIVATFPTGMQEYITGFRNEAESIAWLGSEACTKWLAARGYGR